MALESRIGLALGGGGARGMVHILACEVFDELGVKPAVIAGTSIGAIIGAGYAAGVSGREMRELACAFYAQRRQVLAKLWRARPLAFTDLLRGRSLSAQFDPRLILESFVPGIDLVPETFEELKIPLRIVTTDFYSWTEALLSEGPLKPAIAASIAIPAVFRPMQLDGRFLIDGGACNPLPFEHVADCDITVACDVTGGPTGTPERAAPGLMECIIGAAQISMQAVIREKLRWRQPDILARPVINGVFVLDFLKTQALLEMNAEFKDDLKRRLDHAINTPIALPASAPVAEEPAKKRGRFLLADSGINLWRMVAGGRAKEADAVLDPAALGVGRPVVKPAEAREGNGRGA
jgi:NTE family protein